MSQSKINRDIVSVYLDEPSRQNLETIQIYLSGKDEAKDNTSATCKYALEFTARELKKNSGRKR